MKAALYQAGKKLLPRAVRQWLRQRIPHRDRPAGATKSEAELSFWESYVKDAGRGPETDYYRKFMMRMGNVADASFFAGKICLDIGCGPKGSLTWAENARARLGLDPLADQYMRFGIDQHDMIYLSSPAESIPLPARYVDVVFSMNSLDHVDDVRQTCAEIRRVLKPGGYFIGSLNLDEPPTATEPWTLTEEFLQRHLFKGWRKEYQEIQPKVHDHRHFGPYRYFFEPCPPDLISQPGPRALWCRFRT